MRLSCGRRLPQREKKRLASHALEHLHRARTRAPQVWEECNACAIARGVRMTAWHWKQAWATLPLALTVWLLMPLAASHAQAIAEQLAACKGETGSAEARIRACTQVIDEAKDDEEIRAEAHLQRGVLHESAGNRDAAIKDYSEIIKI